MAVTRIVANLFAEAPTDRVAFYAEVFGLRVAMDMGWIVTLAGPQDAPVQLSCAAQGGSDTDLPPLSIEVDDFEATLARAARAGHAPVYGPVVEPWGVRRAYLRDPAGMLVNVLTHAATLSPGQDHPTEAP